MKLEFGFRNGTVRIDFGKVDHTFEDITISILESEYFSLITDDGESFSAKTDSLVWIREVK